MKIGTLVIKEYVDLTVFEKDFCMSFIDKGMKAAFGEDVGYSVTMETTCTGVSFRVSSISSIMSAAPRRATSSHRDCQYTKGDVLAPTHISIHFSHGMGYDEAECGKFYEWPIGFVPEFDKSCYRLRIDCIGTHRNYRSRRTDESVGLMWSYDYDTELSELDTTSVFNDIHDMIYNKSVVAKGTKECKEYLKSL
jgi:hypothetical protein